ncbi:MAG: endonuclease Q family protein [Candidatus Aenigmatarchaeota archaeon]
MKFFCDFHIHSKYSRGTSSQMNIQNLSRYGKMKGLNLIGTGDFTHPYWLKELKMTLKPIEDTGLFVYDDMNFMLTTEVSTIYEQDGKTRKIHHIIHASSFEIVDQINEELSKYGDLSSDGRPILNIPSPELVEKLIEIDRDCMITPAHAWTSWFSIFGSKSGFNSIEECYQDQTKHIFSIETGLSSDPPMNFRVSKIDRYTLVSNSDCHSPYPDKIGRECNVFELKRLTFWELVDAIKKKDKRRFLYTIEFFPEEGKYHYTGHRKCGVVLSPREAIRFRNTCPVCRKKLTVGVLQRVEELADRPEGYIPKNSIPFKHTIPLLEIIGFYFKTSPNSKKVWNEYQKLIEKFGNEFRILFETQLEELNSFDERLANFINKIRNNQVYINPGYDGVYGRPIFNGEKEKLKRPEQKTIFDFRGS